MVRIALKRVYEPPDPEDGHRVLVDRLWPRGLSKAKAALAGWLRDVAPSTALRQRFHHHPEEWDAFVAAYEEELTAPPAAQALENLVARCGQGPVTLLYAAKDPLHNNAAVLADILRRRCENS